MTAPTDPLKLKLIPILDYDPSDMLVNQSFMQLGRVLLANATYCGHPQHVLCAAFKWLQSRTTPVANLP